MAIVATGVAALLAMAQAPAQDHDHDHDHSMHPPAAAEPAEPDPHAGHAMPDAAAPVEPVPPVTQADRAAAFPDVAGHAVHDKAVHSYWLLDRFEAWEGEEGGTGLAWEGRAWIGTDLHRLWLRSEGEHAGGSIEGASVEVLYGRAIGRWWDGLVGVRQSSGHAPSSTSLAIGVTGVAPYGVEVDATAYVGGPGDASLALEAEYDMRFTNRLILQWTAGAELHGRDDPRHGVGAGLSTMEAGLRLRYEFRREFAPYVGVGWERAFGRTGDLRAGSRGDRGDARFIAGVRAWF